MTTSTQHTDPYLTIVRSDSEAELDVDGSRDRADWQRMWHRTRSLQWRTLALVPGDDQTSALDVANLIAQLALDHGESVRVADVRALRSKHVEAFLDGARWETEQGGRIVFATRSAATSLATVPLARAADCVILCVSLGSTSLKSIEDTIEQIGRRSFLGSLLVHPPHGRRSQRARAARGPRPMDPA